VKHEERGKARLEEDDEENEDTRERNVLTRPARTLTSKTRDAMGYMGYGYGTLLIGQEIICVQKTNIKRPMAYTKTEGD